MFLRYCFRDSPNLAVKDGKPVYNQLKLPVVLQPYGHSVTSVGTEENEENFVLLLDPSVHSQNAKFSNKERRR